MHQIVKLEMMRVGIETVTIKAIYEGGKNSTTHFNPFKDTLRIHSYIALHGIIAIICNLLLISMMVLAFHFSNLPTYVPIYISYLTVTSLYLLLVNIFYRVRNIKRLFGEELLAMAIHMLLAHLLLWLTLDIFRWNYVVITPFVVVLVSLINIPLARFLDYLYNRIRQRKSKN